MRKSVARGPVLNSMHDPVEPNTTLFSSSKCDLTDAKSRFDIRVQELHAALALAPLPSAAALQQRLRALDASSSKKPHVLGRSVIHRDLTTSCTHATLFISASSHDTPNSSNVNASNQLPSLHTFGGTFDAVRLLHVLFFPFETNFIIIISFFDIFTALLISLCTGVTGSFGSHCIHVIRLACRQCVPSLVSLSPEHVWRHDLRHCRTNKVRRKSIKRRRSFDTNEVITCWMAPANCFKSSFGGGSRCSSQVREVACFIFR